MNRLVVALLLCLSSIQAFSAIQIVQARNFFYLPADFAIDLGDTIRFIWVEGNHPTESVTGAFTSFPLDAANPIYDLILTSAGTFPYECTLHAGIGMVGTITVNASTAPCSLTTSPSGLSASPGFTNVSLSWNVLPNSQGYQMQGRRLGTVPFGAAVSSTNGKTVGGLTPATTYQWKVRALCVGTDDITPFSPLNVFTTMGSKMADPENWPASAPYLASDRLNLELPEGTYDVLLYGVNGSLLFGQQELNAGQHSLPVTELGPGVYLIEIRNTESAQKWANKIYKN